MSIIEEILLVYGPLGVMTLGAAYVVLHLWQELQRKNEDIREAHRKVSAALSEARAREIKLLREMANNEVQDKEQYMLLCQEMQRTLENLGEQLEYVFARERKQ